MNNEELNQVNIDIIFFFLSLITSITSFYIINEKKQSIIDNNYYCGNYINDLYKNNRKLVVIIAGYFFLNAWYSLEKDIKDNKEDSIMDDKLLFYSSLLSLIAAILYLPLGNSNVIIDE